MGADNANDQKLLVKISKQTGCLLYNLRQAVREISFYVNLEKVKFMCLKQDGPNFKSNYQPLKLSNPFTHLGINISSTGSNISVRIGNEKISIDRLSTI